ncbi:unnamed protein product [Adineta steineri]|uniref:F-box domain-containing protein n=1 Tax=Adineta steineri TaxID=433720 RepID=A0A814YLS0_9BILA|nr:unnamed protein product [Adineta steineri]CAF1522133.1 unnamed protein product [Adineta steineri]
MKFDQLPNEILIECFEYLNTFDIFYSFYRLNYRFNKLIRNILLNLNLPEKNQSLFRELFYKLTINSQLRNQIISLKISKTWKQLSSFFSSFSLTDFSQLQLLTLIDLDDRNSEENKSILLSLSNFYNGYPNDLNYETCEILSNLFLPKIQMKFFTNRKIIFITSLTIKICFFDHICQLFKYAPMLNYLHVNGFHSPLDGINEINHISTCAFYLKQFIVDYSEEVDFEIFEFLLKQTPNLEILTTKHSDGIDMTDDKGWQNLIQSSLHHLKIFKFEFIVSTKQNISLDKFQNDFWSKDHHWDIICVVNPINTRFFTIPYQNNKFELNLKTKIFGITLINKSKVFRYVTELYIDFLNENFHDYYFENVESLKIYQTSDYIEKFYINQKQKENFFESLPVIINLSNLKHLDITRIENIISSTDLLNILKKARKLSSLEINTSVLMSLLINDELCQYLNEMIKILIIDQHYDDQFNEFNDLNKFCQVFSNIEQLQCAIGHTSTFLYIINHMTKLNDLRIRLFDDFNQNSLMSLKTMALNLNINCTFV